MPLVMPPEDLCDVIPGVVDVETGDTLIIDTDRTYPGLCGMGGTIHVKAGGILRVGTLHHMAGLFQADPGSIIEVLDVAPTDVDQFLTGLIFAGGTLRIGDPTQPLKSSYLRLSKGVKAGDPTIVLATDPIGWRVGDALVIPDTRDMYHPLFKPDLSKDFEWERLLNYQWETPTIAAISGRTITLSAPALYDHPTCRNRDGSVRATPPIANLTRDVVIRSANPAGHRGHLMITESCDFNIRGVEIVDMGRTTLGPVGLDQPGGVKGRYACHFHMPTTRGGQMIGCSIHRAKKWGLTIHGTHGHTFTDGVIWDTEGSAAMTEDGTESDNEIGRWFMGKVRGTKMRGDGEAAAGLPGVNESIVWTQGPHNHLFDLVLCNAFYGWSPWNFVPVDDPRPQVLRAERIEVIGCWQAIIPWYNGDPNGVRSYLDDCLTWHCEIGRTSYPTRYLTWRRFTHRNDPDLIQTPNWFSFGVTFGDYHQVNVIDEDIDVEGATRGVFLPIGAASNFELPVPEENYRLVRGLIRDCLIHVHIYSPVGAYGAPDQFPTHSVIQGLKHVGPGTYLSKVLASRPDSNIVKLQRVQVLDHNGVSGDDFELYSLAQVPEFVIPADGFAEGANGLTNAEAWRTRGIAIAGMVAPVDAQERPQIEGLVGPLLGDVPPPPDPPPDPVPVDCVLSDWSAWSDWGPWMPVPMFPTQEQRERVRTRTVTTPPANGGAVCGPREEFERETRPIVVTPPPNVCATDPNKITKVTWPDGLTGAQQIRFSSTKRTRTSTVDRMPDGHDVLTVTDDRGCVVKVTK